MTSNAFKLDSHFRCGPFIGIRKCLVFRPVALETAISMRACSSARPWPLCTDMGRPVSHECLRSLQTNQNSGKSQLPQQQAKTGSFLQHCCCQAFMLHEQFHMWVLNTVGQQKLLSSGMQYDTPTSSGEWPIICTAEDWVWKNKAYLLSSSLNKLFKTSKHGLEWTTERNAALIEHLSTFECGL